MTTPALALAATFALLALAGCAAAPQTHLTVEFGGRAPTIDTDITPSGTPSQPHYDRAGADHPGGYTAFDQLAQWAADGDHTLDVERSSFGFFLCGIDGHPGRGAMAYWSLEVNGTSSMVGMEQVRVVDGSRVTWRLQASEYPNCPPPAAPTTGASAAQAVELAAPALLRVREAQATVQGTGTPGTGLAVRAGDVHVTDATVAANGTWQATLTQVAPGRTTYTVEALGTLTRVAATTVVVREVEVTLEARFSGYPGATDRTDQVWLDVDAAASAPQYEGKDLAHPGYATVHDAMVAWAAQAGAEVEYTYSNGLGYAVSRIDGVGSPVATGLLSAAWCYELDGASADKGISSMPIQAGQTVTWTLGCAM